MARALPAAWPTAAFMSRLSLVRDLRQVSSSVGLAGVGSMSMLGRVAADMRTLRQVESTLNFAEPVPHWSQLVSEAPAHHMPRAKMFQAL